MSIQASEVVVANTGDIFWDNESYAIKHYMKMFAELASATLKQVAD